MDEDDPYQGKYALFPTTENGKKDLSDVGISFIASGDVEILKDNEIKDSLSLLN